MVKTDQDGLEVGRVLECSHSSNIPHARCALAVRVTLEMAHAPGISFLAAAQGVLFSFQRSGCDRSRRLIRRSRVYFSSGDALQELTGVKRGSSAGIVVIVLGSEEHATGVIVAPITIRTNEPKLGRFDVSDFVGMVRRDLV